MFVNGIIRIHNNVLPSDCLYVTFVQHFQYLFQKIILQIPYLSQSVLLHKSAADRRTFPNTFWYFISTHMESSQFYSCILIHPYDFINHFFKKMISGRHGNINHIVCEILCRQILGSICKVSQKIFFRFRLVCSYIFLITGIHGLNRCPGMSGNVYFGNNSDMPFFCVFQNIHEVTARIISIGQ